MSDVLATLRFLALCMLVPPTLAFSQDEYEPDDSPLSAQRWPVAQSQMHSFHHGGDEDWIAFRDQGSCIFTGDWQIYADGPEEPRFQPVIEVYSYERLVDPDVPPVSTWSACGMPASSEQQAIVFTEDLEGLWRIRNCPDVSFPDGGVLNYLIEQVGGRFNCSPLGRIEGQVLDADNGTPITGGIFIGSDQNIITFSDPDDAAYSMAVLAARPGTGPSEITVWAISERWHGPPVTALVSGEEVVTGVNLELVPIDLLFQDGFEN